MKVFFRSLLYWLRLKKRPDYRFVRQTYPRFEALTIFPDKVPEEPFANFCMLIPAEVTPLPVLKEDPRGAPLYAECPAQGEPCACTGACRQIIGWSQDPKMIAEHQAFIERQELLRKGTMDEFRRFWDQKS